MVIDSNKLIFIHINRTAGTSIERFFNQKPKNKHWVLQQYANKYDLTKYTTFTIVRNPFDRFVSMYEFRRERHDEKRSFEAFARKPSGFKKPMVDWLRIDGEIAVDMVLKFETLKSDFKAMCDTLNISKGILPHKFKTTRTSYKNYYTDETKQIVQEMYKEDLFIFEYDF